MRRKLPQGVFFLLSSTVIFATFYLSLFRTYHRTRLSPATNGLSPSLSVLVDYPPLINNPNNDDDDDHQVLPRAPSPPFSVLFPDWEVVVFLDAPLHHYSPPPPPSSSPTERFTCHFQDGSVSPARPETILRFAAAAATANTTFKCRMPSSVRRLRPFFSPVVSYEGADRPETFVDPGGPFPEMARWSFLTYEALSTEKDVILFSKGVNGRQGRNVPESSLRCVFSHGAVTPVTTSSQEVFRCPHPFPPPNVLHDAAAAVNIKVSLEVSNPDGPPRVVPTTAYYTRPPPRNSAPSKSLLCACTMIRDAAKFLREWVTYHAAVGVDRFFLYDNGSEDDVAGVLRRLSREGYRVRRTLWAWEKTQEAGFSHCAVSYKDTCTWMMFIDVDEFLFSPYWLNASAPSRHMIPALLPSSSSSSSSLLLTTSTRSTNSTNYLDEEEERGGGLINTSSTTTRLLVGQVSVPCHEFGPSNRRSHPAEGVTQGYTCRRGVEQRHKSIVLLEAMEETLLNLVHHFELKSGYGSKKVSKTEWVVNHYKYQAWSEFKKKFRRRVSAYVVDWRSNVNPTSQDRAPGVGFVPVEPEGWRTKFCEVNDTQLQVLNERWFGRDVDAGDHIHGGQRMAWQDE